MGFDKVEQAVPNFPELERRILDLWKERRVFERAVEQSQGQPEFVFYEGPPTANGLPHNGHVLTRVIKDLFPRYQSMRGRHVARRAGWDTHGLPVEVEVEKELRISGKEAILEYGVDRFNKRCMASVFRYISEWEHMTERVGFWVDLDQAYVTYHKTYVESVWWALSKLFERGLLYKGHKSVWWWAQGGTALSAGEVGNAYKTVDDPSVFVRFPLRDEDASLVVWTTTPWTLPSNQFAAVHPEFDYAYAKDGDQTLILAAERVEALSEKVGRPFSVEKIVKGRDLVGRPYRPPFDAFWSETADRDSYWRVVAGDRSTSPQPQYFVTLDSGTGVVHIAPAFGEDDWKLWRRLAVQEGQQLHMFCAVRPDGKFDHRLADLGLEGVWVKKADKTLEKDLESRGLLVHSETYRHEYPFCWRSENDPLIQYVRDAWFVRTTAEIDRILQNNEAVDWMPEHIKHGRMGDFLAGNVDWALSRERFWGTPLNIWTCDACEHRVAPASCAEIEKMNPDAFRAFREAQAEDPELSEHLIVHKPWIDQVELPCERCGGTMKRESEVIDVWFDAGCMPFAQLGYPHVPGSEEAFARAYPADFISEAVDQTRGWFYALMTIGNLVFPDEKQPHPFKRCIVLGLVLDKKGKKESKSSGNYTPPEVILDSVRLQFGVWPDDAAAARGIRPNPGEAWVAVEDLEGLDAPDGARMHGYRLEVPGNHSPMVVKRHKKLPRRVVVLHPDDRARLELEPCPADVMPAEVPKLPSSQRFTLEVQDVPAPGADAFRWFFYASNPPWNGTRHSLGNVRTLQKELPIKLRNVYAFFVTYARIDGFDPVGDADAQRPVRDRTRLDRWILSELEVTKEAVLDHMDAFQSYEATQAIQRFVDGLSNWFVRRSRDRFWAEGRGTDKLDAHWTLYTCLEELCRLVAPFLPFAAEDMYQNLVVRPFGDQVRDSVHLRQMPALRPEAKDEALSRAMAEVRELVSSGLQVRAAHKLKIRQMLAEATLVPARADRHAALEPYLDIVREELNVRSVFLSDRAEDFVHFRVKPNFKALGKRLGPKMKALQRALSGADPSQLLGSLETSGHVTVSIDDGSDVELTRDDLVVQVEAKEGFAAASSGAGVVVLDTKLDEGLREEGRFREVLAKVQARRKELDLEFTDRIALALRGSKGLVDLCARRSKELERETLTVDLRLGGSVGGPVKTVQVEGDDLEIEMAVVR
ncbi:MAG TPA: isoleucine--tRNA ligase [Myxococcales bacterium LLY-WYZ-16_1]|nr:isoleucine--tRNA ligase [Myxococcales bacterium LLY-WYZ-16_1]